jgi:NADH-quinone oxidoreductase subunit C
MSDEPDTPKPPEPAGSPDPPAPAAARPADARPAAAAKPADPLKTAVASRAVELLRAEKADAIADISYHAGQALVRVPRARLIEVLGYLRDHDELRFDYLSNLTAVHWPKNETPFEIVYHLFSIAKRHRLTVKTAIAEGEEPPTATSLWPTANWHEREVFDLFGIRFAGHPDLTRILLTDEWVGHPLRKEYPLAGKEGDHVQYREVTTAQHVYTYTKAPLRGFGWKKEVEKTGHGRG